MKARLAAPADLPALKALMDLAIGENLKGWLSPDLVEASRAVMGLDSTLIADGTYWRVDIDDVLAGCGGWSRRATLYGGDHSGGRDARRLDPVREPARVRAMYTHPDFVRRGVGGLILGLCQEAAAAEGFTRLELMATLAGQPLYTAWGFRPIEAVSDNGVPLIRMGMAIVPRPLD